jgi:8-amino-7-oxononanoate synthase
MFKIPNACPQSPIFAVRLRSPRKLAAYLQKEGMMVRAVVPPTVPVGTERVRICLHAGNTVAEVEKLVQSLRSWCENYAETTPEGDLVSRARL